MPQIEHIVVLMMENHSFDNLLGMVPYQVPAAAASTVSPGATHRIVNFNPDATGQRDLRHARHLALPARGRAEPVVEREPRVLRRRPQRRLRQGERPDRDDVLGPERPPVHVLAGAALPDRRALLLLGARADLPEPALPVRRHGLGTIATNADAFITPAANGTIFDRLDAHEIDWRHLLPADSPAL